MENGAVRIDLIKLIKYCLKRIWLVILCGALGFGVMYYRTNHNAVDTYTASGTMYVYNSNPNLINYQYASSMDLSTAVQLIDTYLVVVRSNKVMDVVAERLSKDYPDITPEFIAGTLSMSSVSETGVVRVSSTTMAPLLSMDIVNAVLDVAPDEILRVVGAGSIEVIDYATEPPLANSRGGKRRGLLGALAGCVLAGCLLLVLFLMNQKVTDAAELTQRYTPPILASVRRTKKNSKDPGAFLLNQNSTMELIESYAKLRMNLLYTMVGKEGRAVVVTSAISGEGKSTIAANLAISCAMSGRRTLLVDADLRRACQQEIFGYSKDHHGISEVLVGMTVWQDAVIRNIRDGLDLLPTGQFPPNPSELLESPQMQTLMEDLEKNYDLILLDMPPVNIVSDPLVPSTHAAGCIFVVRQNYSDNRDIRKALIAAEMTGMEVLGFVFYGEKASQGSYYNRKYYHNYYNKYDYRRTPAQTLALNGQTAGQAATAGTAATAAAGQTAGTAAAAGAGQTAGTTAAAGAGQSAGTAAAAGAGQSAGTTAAAGQAATAGTAAAAGAGQTAGTPAAAAAAPLLTVSMESWTYGEAPKAPVVETQSSGAQTVSYKAADADDAAYSSEVPTDAGNYRVRVRLEAAENYPAMETAADFTIERKPLTVKADDADKVYGQADPVFTASVTGANPADKVYGQADPVFTASVTGANPADKVCGQADPVFTGSVADADAADEETGFAPSYIITREAGEDVGTYAIHVTGPEDQGNYRINWEDGSLTIRKATPAFTAPTARALTFNGEQQELALGGATRDGLMVYALSEDGTYTPDIPTGRSVGVFSVWYYVQGDGNHEDSEKTSFAAMIAPPKKRNTIAPTGK